MAEESTTRAWLSPRMLPLNSQRLTLRLLQAMAMELGLPTNATKEDLRQMINGQLRERGKDPLNVRMSMEERYSHLLLVTRRETSYVWMSSRE